MYSIGSGYLFTGKIAQNYEKWYNTPKGRYADRLEKDEYDG